MLKREGSQDSDAGLTDSKFVSFPLDHTAKERRPLHGELRAAPGGSSKA